MEVFDKTAAVQELAEKITPAQLCRLARVHRINVEDVQDVFQNMICELLGGTATFNPAKGKLEHWARATLSFECLTLKSHRHIGVDDFKVEDSDNDFLVNRVQLDSFEVAEVNDKLDHFESTDNPIWDNTTTRLLNKIHEEFELDFDFWNIATTRDGWAKHHGLTLKGGDQLADRLAASVGNLVSDGVEVADILAIFNLKNKGAGRQRIKKVKKDVTDTVSLQVELF